MSDPTPAEQERALNPEREASIRKWIADSAASIGVCALMEEVDHLRAALAKQREQYEPLVAVVEAHLAYHESVAETVPDKETSSGFIEQAKAALRAIDVRSDPMKCPACDGTGKCGVCNGTGKNWGEGCWGCGIGSKPGVCESCRGKRVFTDDEIRARLDAGDPTLESDMRRAAIERGCEGTGKVGPQFTPTGHYARQRPCPGCADCRPEGADAE